MRASSNILFLIFCFVLSPSFLLAEGNVADGKAKYDQLCAQCHGPKGAGDGPVGASLPPAMKPADLSKGAYKFAVDAEKFKELLAKGGAAVGLNALMPPQAGLSDEDVANLYAFILSLKE